MSLFTRRSRQPWVWLTGALCLLGLAGAAPEAGAQGAVSRVVVNPTSATLIAGQSVDLAAQAVDRRGNEVPDVAFTFTSSRPGTAGVNPLGPAQARVTGVAAGTARITVRGGGKTANVEITVIANPGGGNVLAAGLGTVNHVLVDDEFVFWTEVGNRVARVRRAPLGGGAIVDLVSEPSQDRRGVGVSYLQLQRVGDEIFFTRQSSGFEFHFAIRRVSRNGGAVREVLAEDISAEPLLTTAWRAVGRFLVVLLQAPARLGLSADTRLAAFDTENNRWRTLITGRWAVGRVAILAARNGLVFVRGGTPARQTEYVAIDPEGEPNTPDVLFNDPIQENAIAQPGAVDDANLYFFTAGNRGNLALRAIPVEGGTARTLVIGRVGFGLISDGINLYFVRDPGVLIRLPLTGGAATEIRRNLVVGPTIGGIAQTGTELFLAETLARRNVGIVRVPK